MGSDDGQAGDTGSRRAWYSSRPGILQDWLAKQVRDSPQYAHPYSNAFLGSSRDYIGVQKVTQEAGKRLVHLTVSLPRNDPDASNDPPY